MVGVMGLFSCKVYDRRRRLVAKWRWKNAAVYEGLNTVNDGAFSGGVLSSVWYIGLIAGGASPSLSANDTMLSHPGWTEFTGYDEAGRQAWSPGSSASGSKTSSSPTVFTITADSQVRGVFLVADNTKGGTTGPLWATAAGGNRTLLAGQQFEVTYTNRFTPIS